MSPSTSTSGSGPSASRPGRTETSRFRCACGRSVAAQRGSEAADTGRCSSCRSRRRADAPLTAPDPVGEQPAPAEAE